MSNPFITKECPAEVAEKLVEAGVGQMDASGKVPWAKVEEQAGTDVGYSRGWLVVRWAYLAQNEPDTLVDADAYVSAQFRKATTEGKSGDFDPKAALQHLVIRMRDEQQLSWGEIAVRLGMPESRVRSAYRHNGVRKDLGLRIGKGGRFAYGAGELYTDNRKKEGAHIPHDLKAKPTVEQLLNYVPKEGEKPNDAKQRKAAIARLLKIQDLLNDGATPQAQRDAQKPRFEQMLAKWNVTLRDLAVARKARDSRKAA